MNFITGKHISRRALLRGMGASIGLPLLDAMFPAGRLWASTKTAKAASRTRLVCIEQVHGLPAGQGNQQAEQTSDGEEDDCGHCVGFDQPFGSEVDLQTGCWTSPEFCGDAADNAGFG